jgi:hypothetical protein
VRRLMIARGSGPWSLRATARSRAGMSDDSAAQRGTQKACTLLDMLWAAGARRVSHVDAPDRPRQGHFVNASLIFSPACLTSQSCRAAL